MRFGTRRKPKHKTFSRPLTPHCNAYLHLHLVIDMNWRLALNGTCVSFHNIGWVPKWRLQSLDFLPQNSTLLSWPSTSLKRPFYLPNLINSKMRIWKECERECYWIPEAYGSICDADGIASILPSLSSRGKLRGGRILRAHVIQLVWSSDHSHLSSSQVHSSKQLQHYTYNTSQMSDVRLSTYWGPQALPFDPKQKLESGTVGWSTCCTFDLRNQCLKHSRVHWAMLWTTGTISNTWMFDSFCLNMFCRFVSLVKENRSCHWCQQRYW